MTMTDNVAR